MRSSLQIITKEGQPNAASEFHQARPRHRNGRNQFYNEICLSEFKARKASPSYADIFEAMAGEAHCTFMAPQYGLVGLSPCDTRYNWTLSTLNGRRMLESTINNSRPLLFLCGFSCTEWCRWNVWCQYKDRPEELKARQEALRPALRSVICCCFRQADFCNFFLFRDRLGQHDY